MSETQWIKVTDEPLVLSKEQRLIVWCNGVLINAEYCRKHEMDVTDWSFEETDWLDTLDDNSDVLFLPAGFYEVLDEYNGCSPYYKRIIPTHYQIIEPPKD